MVWTEFKDDGKVAFSQGNFDSALSSYLTALEELTSEERRDGSDKSNDKQILLSNVVACRLKIGGEEMVTQAVEEAKQVSSSYRYCVSRGNLCTPPPLPFGRRHTSDVPVIVWVERMIISFSLVRVLDAPPT